MLRVQQSPCKGTATCCDCRIKQSVRWLHNMLILSLHGQSVATWSVIRSRCFSWFLFLLFTLCCEGATMANQSNPVMQQNLCWPCQITSMDPYMFLHRKHVIHCTIVCWPSWSTDTCIAQAAPAHPGPVVKKVLRPKNSETTVENHGKMTQGQTSR